MGRPVDVTARQLPVELLRFRVEGVELLVGALDVEEIVSLGAVTAVPGVPRHIAGLLALRGQALPLLDLASFFSLPPGPRVEDRAPRVVVVHKPPFRVGLIADVVVGMLPVPSSMSEPTVMQPSRLRELAIAELDLGDRLGAFLDLRLLLEAARA